MRIMELKLENFQGIKSAVFRPDGKSADFYGANGSGKTTVCNAVSWLLFGRPADGSANWDPKTRDENGEVHGLDHSVTAVLEMDGRTEAVKKVFREIWKKKRGSARAEYAGNTTEYSINGVPMREKDFAASIEAWLGGEERMKLLMLPGYFAADMDWKKRRELLLEVCGDVEEEAVIASDPRLERLKDFLTLSNGRGQYTTEAFTAICKARRTEINKKLDSLPGRIDEATRAIPADLPEEEEINGQLETLEARGKEIDWQISRLTNGDHSLLQAALSNAQAKYAAEEARHLRGGESLQADMEAMQAAAREELTETATAEHLKAAAGRKAREAEVMAVTRDNLRERWKAIQSEVWDKGQAMCPTCGQALPEEQVQERREAFHLEKSRRLEQISAEGKACSKEVIEAMQAEVRQLNEKAAICEQKAREASHRREAIAEKMKAPPPYAETEEGREALARMEELKERIRAIQADTEAATADLREDLDGIRKAMEELLRQKAALRTAETQKKRVEELQEEEASLNRELEQTEEGLFLCEAFTRAKVALLTEQINERFKNVSFRLFQEQVNGGLKECCDVMIPCPGAVVPYGKANTASRINAGLDIINVLAEHYGMNLPVLLDGAESVTEPVKTTGQMLRFIVSPEDRGLRMMQT